MFETLLIVCGLLIAALPVWKIILNKTVHGMGRRSSTKHNRTDSKTAVTIVVDKAAVDAGIAAINAIGSSATKAAVPSSPEGKRG